MNRIILAFVLLIGTIIYLIARISVKTLSLLEISVGVDNPVSFNWLSIGINTNFVENSSKAIYSISMLPIYLFIVLAILLLVLGLRKNRN